MPQRLRLAPDLSAEKLGARYLDCRDATEETHWQVLWPVIQGGGAPTSPK